MATKTASSPHPATTVVFDAGGRYGMHPRWRDFRGELRYFGFEPDPHEAARLTRVNAAPYVTVFPIALASTSGKRTFRLYKHRGYSSFFELDPQYGRIGHYRPGEGAIEEQVEVDVHTVDEVAKREQVAVDFMKVDVEGAELDVLQGAAEQIRRSLMAVRTSIWLAAGFKGGGLFPELHQFFLDHGFFLANLDYAGRGYPVHPLVGNPDCQEADHDRYGVFSTCEAVYLRKLSFLEEIPQGSAEMRGGPYLKYAYFCFLNDAPDSALNCLLEFSRRSKGYSDEIKATKLYIQLRLLALRYLGRWRTNPTNQNWKLAQSIAEELFGVHLESGHKYWELVQELECVARGAV